MTDLDKLIAAVEAGAEDALYAALRVIASSSRDKGEYWPAHDAIKAFDGSLDAALRLHEALLPGWRARIDVGRRFRAWEISDQNAKIDAYAENPARAWLLSILRALKEKGQ